MTKNTTPWFQFASEGDDWLIAYALICAAPPLNFGPLFFAVGHAVELYLKATHIKFYGDVDKAINYGHNNKKLWDDCKKHGEFMSAYEIRDSIFKQDFLNPEVFNKFSGEESQHFAEFQNLYLIFKYLKDLKYYHLPWKPERDSAVSTATKYPDPFWIKFFRALRYSLSDRYLIDYDHIAQWKQMQSMMDNLVPDISLRYLNNFIG